MIIHFLNHPPSTTLKAWERPPLAYLPQEGCPSHYAQIHPLSPGVPPKGPLLLCSYPHTCQGTGFLEVAKTGHGVLPGLPSSKG